MKLTKEMDLIYKRYYNDVYAFCVRLCEGGPDVAEDICQETFFKALKTVNSFRGDCKVMSWLCQIAKNTYISYLRKDKHLLKSKDKVVQEKSYSEIAAVYHKSENWARVTFFRAKQRIVEQMKQEGHYE